MERSDNSPTTVASKSEGAVLFSLLSSEWGFCFSVFDFRSSRNFSSPLIIHPPPKGGKIELGKECAE